MEPQLNKPYMYETTLIIILFIYILVNTIFVVAICDHKLLKLYTIVLRINIF